LAVARAEAARPVALARRLDLDHRGAVLRQQHRAIRAGDALAQIDNLEAGEGCGVAHDLVPRHARSTKRVDRAVRLQARRSYCNSACARQTTDLLRNLRTPSPG